MEVSRTASTSRGGSTPTNRPSSISASSDRPLTSKRPRPDIVAPSSPSKPKPRHHPAPGTRLGRPVSQHDEARRQASLLSFAEARARASSTYTPAGDAAHEYPPGYVGESSARGLLAQIKNRVEARTPKASNFLQTAKQVQQALLAKQQNAADAQRRREAAARRESARSGGFADEHADPAVGGANASGSAASASQGNSNSGVAGSQGAFARAKQPRPSIVSDAESSDDEDAADDAHSGLVGRDDDLALVERLRPGPRAIPPNPDDPKWERMEPFSGHRLRERRLPHSTLKEHLRGRYHLPPSLLYSIARPISVASMHAHGGGRMDWNAARNGDYEVPVDGDWIVMATIVEKSEILMTRGFEAPATTATSRGGAGQDDDPVLFKDAAAAADGTLRLDLEPGNSDAFAAAKTGKGSKRNAESADDELERYREETRLNQRPRKFVILKLVDLGVNSTAGDGSGSAGRGDNYLSLIAFESDALDRSIVARNTNVRSDVSSMLAATARASKAWVNGSRGAFELLYPLPEGTLVAIMNPKVLRPFVSASGASGRPGSLESKMLRITPRSADDCLVVGQAADYRRCSAIKANGQRCESFVDVKARKQTRSTTCDYHLSRHMDELARGRPEFAANATTRFGGSSSSSSSGAGAARSGGRLGDPTSAINAISTAYKTPFSASNPFSRAALEKKLNSSFGSVGDGMESNGGQVYVSASPLVGEVGADAEMRASDPASWKYDVAGRYGRGQTEKQTRLRKQIEEEQLLRQIEARFAPATPASAQTNSAQADDGNGSGDGERGESEGGGEGGKKQGQAETVLPVLPNGTADLMQAAYSTLDQRKRAAHQKRETQNAKRFKYTGVATRLPTASAEHKLKFAHPATQSRSAATPAGGGLPIPGLTRPAAHADRPKQGPDSRSKLLSLVTTTTEAARTATARTRQEPNLRIQRAHRPKLRLPSDEIGRTPQLKVVGGELVNLQDFDDAWEDDLDDHAPTHEPQDDAAREETGLGERILQLQSQSLARRSVGTADNDSDSDLEII